MSILCTVTACSTGIIGDPTKPISLIKTAQEGSFVSDRPDMASICKGFYMPAERVNAFFLNSSRVGEEEISAKYRILPCYAKGTAAINGKLYTWVIRAGGIGEFITESDRFFKVCGKQCCSKVTGVC